MQVRLAAGIEHGRVYANVGGVHISDTDCNVTVGVMFWFACFSVVFCIHKVYIRRRKQWCLRLPVCHLNEWMNEWCIYIALYYVLLYTQSALCGGGGGGLSSTTTSVQHPLGWCDGCHRTTAPVRSPHTSYRWRGERVIEPIKWMGIIRRPWLTRASGGNLAPTLYEKCPGIFNDHRESGPRFNVSSEGRCFFTV